MAERVDFINRERLLGCLDQMAMDLTELAQRANIKEDKLRDVLEERRTLTINQTRRLAQALGRGLFFLLMPGPMPEENNAAHFRTIINHDPSLTSDIRLLIQQVEKHRRRYLMLLEELDRAPRPIDLPPPDTLPDELRKWLGWDQSSSFEQYRAALEARGFMVVLSNGYKGRWHIPRESDVMGFSLPYDILPVIFVRKMDYPARQVFTLAHEVAHILLHHEPRMDMTDNLWALEGQEAEANTLAGQLLVPDKLLDDITGSGPLPETPEEMAGYLMPWRDQTGVSAEVIVRRLVETGRLTRRFYQSYRAWLQELDRQREIDRRNRRGGGQRKRYQEPIRLFGDQYVRTVLQAWEDKHITLPKASDYLDGIKVKDIAELEKALVRH